ncbi:hypothetical protein [Actinokineospora xionganensis]|uniref:Uncharacterized protein n=1 Tax=Actinokineospora xionganensis TaxID=2684470 RepID=A0ABR7L520_9PSEU|nr:hypothetical protein [Actinokineospora xionganensis]MBC6447775.1 hypothetical protein [Actinokineospora xionganensis]
MRPLEVRLSAAIVLAAAVVFLGHALLREDPGVLRFPLVLAVIAAVALAAMWTRLRAARLIAVVAVGLLALAHTVIALGALPWWVRVSSGLLAAAHVYVVILLLTGPARAHFTGVPND